MPDDLASSFQQAADDVTKLSQAPDSDAMLRLYALYKQASQGDCAGDRPGIMDFVRRAKFDAWKALAGTPQENAMRDYVAFVDELKAADK